VQQQDGYQRSGRGGGELIDAPLDCPHCGVSLIGNKIPEEDRKWFGGKSNFKREIGIYDTVKDRTVKFRCPDCQGEWMRA
jgi:predicted RNA-binding Zn-ribbon protein involved in translation (DUF1610 family)